MRVNFLATEQHYRDHLRPVYDALPETMRGTFAHTPRELPDKNALVAVASYGDLRMTTGPVVYFEHGTGYHYGTDHPSFAGGRGKHRVVLFCSTNAIVDGRNRAAYPYARHEIVGCPKLDRWAQHTKTANDTPTIAISFHWDSTVAPEARWAFPHYRDILGHLASWGYRVIGHAHPRSWPQLEPIWRLHGWELEQDFDKVVERADLYIADTTSTLYEFAVVGPVVVLNAPWYRRDVEHGIRFWQHVPGVQVDEPHELRTAIAAALQGRGARQRRAAVDAVYPFLGQATQRAANAIAQLVRDYRAHAERDLTGTLEPYPLRSEADDMKQRPIATRRIYGTKADGSRVLIANIGDPIPEGYEDAVIVPPPPAEEPEPAAKARREEQVEDKARRPAAKRTTSRPRTSKKAK